MFNKTYIFSGLPCTGKTTLISLLKDRYSDHCLFVPEFMEPLPEFVYSAGKSDLESRIKAQNWIVEQYATKTQIALNEHKGRPIIMDRGLIDALAFSQALGTKVYKHTIQFAEKFLWIPGIIILLSTSDIAIKERFIVRYNLHDNEWSEHWFPYLKRVKEGYQKAKELRTENKYIYFNTNKELSETQSEIELLFDSFLNKSVGKERDTVSI